MVGERSAHHLARERVDDDGQIDEGLGEPDISDVGDPDLVEAGRLQPAHEVGRIGRSRSLIVVRGTKGLARSASKLSSRIGRSTRLALTIRPCRRSSWAIRRYRNGVWRAGGRRGGRSCAAWTHRNGCRVHDGRGPITARIDPAAFRLRPAAPLRKIELANKMDLTS
jgi:hypothetical protein